MIHVTFFSCFALLCFGFQMSQATSSIHHNTLCMSLPRATALDNQKISLLTLEAAIDRAQKNRPDLKAYDQLISALYWQARTELMGYAPRLTIDSSLLLERNHQGFHGSTTIMGNQLLYQFGGPLEKYQRDRKFQNFEIKNKEHAQNAIRFAVEQAFLSAWLLQNQEHAILAHYRAAQSTYKQAQHEWKLDLLDRSVYYAARATYAATRSSVEQFYFDVNAVQQSLSFLLGEKESFVLAFSEQAKDLQAKNLCTPVFLSWSPAQKLTIRSLAFYHHKALLSRADLSARDEQIAALKDDVSIARKSNLPILGLAATVSHRASNPAGEKNAFSAGPTVSWNIFDGTVSAHQTRKAQALYLADILKREQLELQVKTEVATAYYALRKAVSQLNAHKVSLKATRNDFVLKKEQYAIGDISLVTLKEAQATWRQEYFSWQKVIIDVSTKERELAWSCGYPQDHA